LLAISVSLKKIELALNKANELREAKTSNKATCSCMTDEVANKKITKYVVGIVQGVDTEGYGFFS